MSILNHWLFYTIAAIILNVLFYQGYKLAVRNAKHDGAATVVLQSIAGITTLIFIPFYSWSFPTNITTYFFLLLACLFYALSNRLGTTTRKHIEVSVYSILGQSATVFLILYGFFLFREPILFTKILGSALILFANFLLLHKKGKITIDRYTFLTILGWFFFSTAISIDIITAKQFNLGFYVFLTLAIPAMYIIVAERISWVHIRKEFNTKDKKYYIYTGVAWGLYIILGLRALQLGQVTTVIPLQATTVLLNVIVAYIFLGEKSNKMKKFLAALIVIIGIYITVL